MEIHHTTIVGTKRGETVLAGGGKKLVFCHRCAMGTAIEAESYYRPYKSILCGDCFEKLTKKENKGDKKQ